MVDDKMTKDELQMWATCFSRLVSVGTTGDITFSYDGRNHMTCTELCERIRPFDALLAYKVAAWHAAAIDLGRYVATRLDHGRQPGPTDL